jgi:anti-sigma regulatory factor (Ser/Thr protein kinase)
MNGVVLRVPVIESSQVAEARRLALRSAAGLGFSEAESGRVALVVTEIATNLVKHGAQGEVLIRDLEPEGRQGLEVLALDKGPGMENVSECMRDGYSTAGSHGNGLGAIRRLSDAFDVYSAPGKGTALAVRFLLKGCAARNLPFEIAGFSVAVKGEQVCGDAWAFQATSESATVLAVDGLGHGFQAEEAARGAMEVFEHSPDLPPVELLNSIHLKIRSTRGAAAAIAWIDFPRQVLHYAGVGNLSGVIVSGNEARHLVSMNGTLGHEIRALRKFEYPWPPGSALILHSDGLSARWDLKDYPGLLRKPAALIAGVLYRDAKRERDDATAVVLKQGTQE